MNWLKNFKSVMINILEKDVEYIHVGHEHFLSSMKSLGWRLCGINLILKKITEEKLKFTKPSP